MDMPLRIPDSEDIGQLCPRADVDNSGCPRSPLESTLLWKSHKTYFPLPLGPVHGSCISGPL